MGCPQGGAGGAASLSPITLPFAARHRRRSALEPFPAEAAASVRSAIIVALPAAVDEQRFPGRRDDEGGSAAFHVDEVDIEWLRRRRGECLGCGEEQCQRDPHYPFHSNSSCGGPFPPYHEGTKTR